jgi:predicted dehydrogenase
MQGVRQLAPGLGETVVVVGLGIVGQLTTQLAVAAGCRVIAADVSLERVERAQRIAGCNGVDLTTSALNDAVAELTKGRGADGVILTAATSSSDPINAAMSYCRDRGRVVIVGDVGLALRRTDFYTREIDVRISRSYGPGRYDPEYEEGGVDYPLGYVRWTEQRNLECFLDLIASAQVDVMSLIDLRVPVDQAPNAYQQLKQRRGVIGAVLEYSSSEPRPASQAISVASAAPVPRHGHVNVALVGVGAFARAVHIPNLRRDSRVRIVSVAARTGITAQAVARDCGAALATTDWREALRSPAQAVIIATRHNLHADQVIGALEAGRHVFVEKPMALGIEDCQRIVEAQLRADRIVIVGFNRRFAPAVEHARGALTGMRGPRNVVIRVNAGRLSPEHWTYGPEGGGRLLGEGCHFFDLARFLVGAEPILVSASSSSGGPFAVEDHDNVNATIEFADGSVGSVIYATAGSSGSSKERLEIYGDGASVIVDDYTACSVNGITGWTSKRFPGVDKGHRALMAHFVSGAMGERRVEMNAHDGYVAQACAIAALRAASTSQTVRLDE